MNPSDAGGAPRAVVPSAQAWVHARQILLDQLRQGPAAGSPAAISDEAWKNVVDEARRHRVHLYLWRCLKDGPWRDLAPENVASALREEYRLHALRNAVLFRQAAGIISAFADAGIPTLLLKGLHLASAVYPEPALRSMADLDLMVSRGQLADAERILLGMGYGSQPRADASSISAHFSHLDRLTRDGAEVVELHHTIELPTSPFPIDAAALWRAARSVQIAGASAYVLSDEHLVLHQCIHLAWHHAFGRAGLKTLLDLTTIANARATTLDWSLVARTALEWHAEAYVRCVLVMARDLLGAAIPDEMLVSLTHDASDDAVVASASRLILARPLEYPAPLPAPSSGEALARRARYLALGLVPPPALLRRSYGKHTVESALRLYPRRWRDLMQRRGATIMQAARDRDTARHVAQHLIDRGRVAHWIGRHS